LRKHKTKISIKSFGYVATSCERNQLN